MSKLDAGVADTVMKYMKSQNRPYSVQNVFDNLRGELPKAKVIIAMDAGVVSGLLVVKAYGAQKIYCAKQLTGDTSVENSVDSSTDMLKAQIIESASALVVAKAQLDSLNSDLVQYEQYVSACTKQSQLESKLKEYFQQISAIETCRSDKESVVSPYSGEELSRQLEVALKHLHHRKRIGKEMIAVISEQCGMSRLEIVDDLGLELDSN